MFLCLVIMNKINTIMIMMDTHAITLTISLVAGLVVVPAIEEVDATNSISDSPNMNNIGM